MQSCAPPFVSELTSDVSSRSKASSGLAPPPPCSPDPDLQDVAATLLSLSPTVNPERPMYTLRTRWNSVAGEACRCVSLAPWDPDFLSRLGIGHESVEPWQKAWLALVSRWTGVVAIVQSTSVSLIRLRRNRAHEVLLKITERDVEGVGLNALAWTFDPVSLVPVIAFGGRSKLVYLWKLDWSLENDLPVASRLRVLEGHTEEILDLKFHPTNPHILASASQDSSVRLWNIFGTDPDVCHSLPRCDGGRGKGAPSVLVGILAGEGGHQDGVTTLNFHPRLPLIVTGGVDRALRIWALPRLPGPFTHGPSACRPSLPFLQKWPVFSSSSITNGAVNRVSWLSDDVLLAHTATPETTVVKWRWLGLDRHTVMASMEKTRFTDASPIKILSKSSGRLVDIDFVELRPAWTREETEHDFADDYAVISRYLPESAHVQTTDQVTSIQIPNGPPSKVILPETVPPSSATRSLYIFPAHTGDGLTVLDPNAPGRELRDLAFLGIAGGTNGRRDPSKRRQEGEAMGPAAKRVCGRRANPPVINAHKSAAQSSEIEQAQARRVATEYIATTPEARLSPKSNEFLRRGGGQRPSGVSVSGEWVVAVGEQDVWLWRRTDRPE